MHRHLLVPSSDPEATVTVTDCCSDAVWRRMATTESLLANLVSSQGRVGAWDERAGGSCLRAASQPQPWVVFMLDTHDA